MIVLKDIHPSFIILFLHDYFIFFVVAQEMLGGVDGIYGQGQGPPSVASGPRNYGQGRSRSIIIILYKSSYAFVYISVLELKTSTL